MVIRAVTETIEALMLRHNIRVKEQNLGGRLAHHTTPRLHLLITGQDFVVPYG